jgi:hypothetical protein
MTFAVAGLAAATGGSIKFAVFLTEMPGLQDGLMWLRAPCKRVAQRPALR